MTPSKEFYTFGMQFIQSRDLMSGTLDDLMRHVLTPFKGEERVRLRDFIDEVLRDTVSDEELRDLWDSTPTNFFFRYAHELRAMLREARDRL